MCVPCAFGKKLTTGKLTMRREFDLSRWEDHKKATVSHTRAIANLEAEEEDRKRKAKRGLVEESKPKAQTEMGGFFPVIRRRRANQPRGLSLTVAVPRPAYVPPPPVYVVSIIILSFFDFTLTTKSIFSPSFDVTDNTLVWER